MIKNKNIYTQAAFIWSKIKYNSNIVKYSYWNMKYKHTVTNSEGSHDTKDWSNECWKFSFALH